MDKPGQLITKTEIRRRTEASVIYSSKRCINWSRTLATEIYQTINKASLLLLIERLNAYVRRKTLRVLTVIGKVFIIYVVRMTVFFCCAFCSAHIGPTAVRERQKWRCGYRKMLAEVWTEGLMAMCQEYPYQKFDTGFLFLQVTIDNDMDVFLRQGVVKRRLWSTTEQW